MEKRNQNQKMMKNEKSSNATSAWHPPTHRRILSKATEGKTYYWTSETTTSYNVS